MAGEITPGEIAEKALDMLRQNPDATIQELAHEIGVSDDEVTTVLDEYRVTGGIVEHLGAGQGGGWLDG